MGVLSLADAGKEKAAPKDGLVTGVLVRSSARDYRGQYRPGVVEGMRRWLSRLVWGAIQIAIAIFTFLAVYEGSQKENQKPTIGVALFLAFFMPIVFTVVCALIADGVKRMWWLVTGRKQAHISEPSSEHDSLSASSGNAGKTLELPRSAWISKKPR